MLISSNCGRIGHLLKNNTLHTEKIYKKPINPLSEFVFASDDLQNNKIHINPLYEVPVVQLKDTEASSDVPAQSKKISQIPKIIILKDKPAPEIIKKSAKTTNIKMLGEYVSNTIFKKMPKLCEKMVNSKHKAIKTKQNNRLPSCNNGADYHEANTLKLNSDLKSKSMIDRLSTEEIEMSKINSLERKKEKQEASNSLKELKEKQQECNTGIIIRRIKYSNNPLDYNQKHESFMANVKNDADTYNDIDSYKAKLIAEKAEHSTENKLIEKYLKHVSRLNFAETDVTYIQYMQGRPLEPRKINKLI